MPTYDARNIYVGDGVTTEFAVNFTLGYLSRTHVTCHVEGEVDGGGNPIYRTFTWLTDGLIEVIPAPGDTLDVTIQRTTPENILYHDYSDGSVIIERNLDESNLQHLMLHHEATDEIVYHLAADNPHEVDASDVGLWNVKNSSLTNGYWILAGSELTTKYALDLIVNGSLFFNDINTGISEDVSGNLIFTDEVTGTKTLAELAAGTGGGTSGFTGTLRDSSFIKLAEIVDGLVISVVYATAAPAMPLYVYDVIVADGLGSINY